MEIAMGFGHCIITVLEYLTCFCALLRVPLCKQGKRYLICGVATFAIALIAGFIFRRSAGTANFAGLIIAVLASACLFSWRFWEAVRLWLVALCSVTILEETLACLVQIALSSDDAGGTLLYMACVAAGLWIYYIVIGRRLDGQAFRMSGFVWLAFFGIMCVMTLMLTCFSYILRNIWTERGANVMLILLMLGGFVVFVLAYLMLYQMNRRRGYESETKMLERYNEQQREYFERLLDKEKDTRRFRHDLIAELVQVRKFCENDDCEAAKQFLGEMLEGISAISRDGYDVGNEIVNTMLNHYLSPLEGRAEIKVKGYVGEELKVSRMDLCVIVSNLVRNAVEAAEECMKLSGAGKPLIRFEIGQGNLFFFIKTVNSFVGEIHAQSNKKTALPATGKADRDSHGFGLKNVSDTAAKYNGAYEFHIEDGLYVAEVKLRI